MPDNTFSDEELSTLKNITEIYFITKNLILYSEELNNLDSFVPPMNEIKDSHDHLMRVFSVKFGLNTNNSPEYVKININKVFSHLYRAAFESLDYIRIFQRDAISEKLRGVSNDALVNVFPEYYKTIRPRVEELVEQIPSYKKDKDIGNPNLAAVKSYYSAILEIKGYIQQIDLMEAALVDFEIKRKNEEIKKNWITVAQLIGAAIIGGIILHYIWP